MRVCVPLSIGDDQNIRLNSESARASGSGGSLTFLSKQGYPANGGRDVHVLLTTHSANVLVQCSIIAA